MDWRAPVDIYCERVTAAFWAEPLNALSNVSFLVAALVAALTLRRLGRRAMPMDSALIWLCALIGVGSFLFHTFANRWSEWADTTPIWAFVGLYLYATITARGAKSVRFKVLAGGIIGAAVIGILTLSATGENAPSNAVDPLNGSGQYAPALITLCVVALLSWRRAHPQWRYFAWAAFVFLVSLTFRTFDMRLCAAWPVGTHFAWHLTNGVLIGILLQAYIRRTP